MKQNMQNQTISELYIDDKKSKYHSSPNDILKSAKYFCEILYTKLDNVQNFLVQLLTERKSQVNNIIIARQTIF